MENYSIINSMIVFGVARKLGGGFVD